jgi:uncharacterized membrane-anchored protein
VALANWYQAIAPRTSLLWPDGIHPQPRGGRLYARVVAAAARAALRLGSRCDLAHSDIVTTLGNSPIIIERMVSETQQFSVARQMLNKVPEVTIFFWGIKVLSTTVGETAADFLDTNLNMGLTATTVLMGSLLIVALFFQFRSRRYIPGIYWVTVVLISVVGTLITDNLSDTYGVPLTTSTAVFTVALVVTFAAWYRSERTLSIHSIHTTRREAFYWLAILFTFALGTAAGDLVAERYNLGYWVTLFLFAALIAVVTVARFGFKANAILTFWIAYILTRPLGASLGDLMSQTRDSGGLGLGTTWTSGLFLSTILSLVAYLAITRRDVTQLQDRGHLTAEAASSVSTR